MRYKNGRGGGGGDDGVAGEFQRKLGERGALRSCQRIDQLREDERGPDKQFVPSDLIYIDWELVKSSRVKQKNRKKTSDRQKLCRREIKRQADNGQKEGREGGRKEVCMKNRPLQVKPQRTEELQAETSLVCNFKQPGPRRHVHNGR